MARIAEPEKMDNIKKAVMELIIEHGYTGMSIASISKKAGVSPGYLYRYYNSKEELVRELADSNMDEIINGLKTDIDSSGTLYEAGYKTVKRLFMKANQDPLTAKFIAAVVMEIRIPAKGKTDNFKTILELADKCIRLGIKTGETNPGITPTEVLVVSFTIPFRYLSISLEIDKNKKFTEEDVKRITDICLKAYG